MPPPQTLRSLGIEIRGARLHRNLSQQEVATLAGVQRYQVANLELGKGNPSFGTLVAVLTALDLELSLTPVRNTRAVPTSQLRKPIDLDEILARSLV
jgi:transcriptional regulator with XRE-family HTH domain